ncbi:MAG TPA: hypothetical protein VGO56_21325 [Pyrinomonadaceae bacterium]|jgi:hypothetical protein|nr:hypothetical protein [Pyrinomonadaceae bacterium]
MSLNKRSRRVIFLFLLLLGFLFRLGFGLCSSFHDEDIKQIYLLGLKFYTTNAWPYFGPDVTATIQIPGALQALVVGLPFHLLPIPEAPYLLVNLLSFLSLCFFAWYCTRRLPEIPKWFVWSWLLTAPWTLYVSTQPYNPSYVLPAAILFFVGATETYPFLSRDLVPRHWANLMMGISLFWIMQFHLSWVVLVPFVALSFYLQFRKLGRGAFSSIAWFVAGAIIPFSFLVPTFIKYGFAAGLGSTNEAAQFNYQNLLRNLNPVEGVLGRFLSFASFELPRFIGANTAARLAFMKQNPWLIPLVVLLTPVGILQSVALLVLWFRKKHTQKDWQAVRFFTLATVLLLYFCFFFSMKLPVSHTFYITLPVAMLYSFYCWNEYLQKRGWQTVAKVFIVCGLLFDIGLAANNYRQVSILRERSKIQEAIKAKDYRLVGERRDGARY